MAGTEAAGWDATGCWARGRVLLLRAGLGVRRAWLAVPPSSGVRLRLRDCDCGTIPACMKWGRTCSAGSPLCSCQGKHACMLEAHAVDTDAATVWLRTRQCYTAGMICSAASSMWWSPVPAIMQCSIRNQQATCQVSAGNMEGSTLQILFIVAVVNRVGLCDAAEGLAGIVIKDGVWLPGAPWRLEHLGFADFLHGGGGGVWRLCWPLCRGLRRQGLLAKAGLRLH